MAEMVRDGIDGLLFPPGDALSLAACLRRLIDEDGLLERLRAGILPPMSIEAEAAGLREMYGAMISRTPVWTRPRPASFRRSARSVAAVVLNYKTRIRRGWRCAPCRRRSPQSHLRRRQRIERRLRRESAGVLTGVDLSRPAAISGSRRLQRRHRRCARSRCRHRAARQQRRRPGARRRRPSAGRLRF